MILVDSGVLYGLVDENDRHHQKIKEAVLIRLKTDRLATSLPILTETLYLLENRLNQEVAWKFWEELITQGTFRVLDVTDAILKLALKIDQKFSALRMGFVDATTLALCEFHRMETLFTLDHRDFAGYRLKNKRPLQLLPEIH